MLVHICCSVDSHYFLMKLQDDFPSEHLIGFFYDPNIHPYSEYLLRLEDVKRSCDILGIDLLEGDYDYQNWLNSIKGFEDEPEKGKRCDFCFADRLRVSAEKSIELNEQKFTTTLLMSPKKSQNKIKEIAKNLEKEFNLEFVFKDYRAKGGSEKQNQVVKEQKLYRQDYCGCIFALKNQRDQQEQFIDELLSPINKQVLPASIEEKLSFYNHLSDDGVLSKSTFLNYRLLKAKVSIKENVIPSYFLIYSYPKWKKFSAKVEHIVDEIAHLNKSGAKIITLEYLNKVLQENFESVNEIKIDIEDEIFLRGEIDPVPYSLSPIIVLEEIPTEKIDVELESKIYFDIKDIEYLSWDFLKN